MGHRLSAHQSAAQRLNYFGFQHLVLINAETHSFPSMHKLRLRIERFLTEERNLTQDIGSADCAFVSTLFVDTALGGFVCIGFRSRKEAAICKLMFNGE